MFMIFFVGTFGGSCPPAPIPKSWLRYWWNTIKDGHFKKKKNCQANVAMQWIQQFIVCHHKLSFHVTMSFNIYFQDPEDVLQMCHTTFIMTRDNTCIVCHVCDDALIVNILSCHYFVHLCMEPSNPQTLHAVYKTMSCSPTYCKICVC